MGMRVGEWEGGTEGEDETRCVGELGEGEGRLKELLVQGRVTNLINDIRKNNVTTVMNCDELR